MVFVFFFSNSILLTSVSTSSIRFQTSSIPFFCCKSYILSFILSSYSVITASKSLCVITAVFSVFPLLVFSTVPLQVILPANDLSWHQLLSCYFMYLFLLKYGRFELLLYRQEMSTFLYRYLHVVVGCLLQRCLLQSQNVFFIHYHWMYRVYCNLQLFVYILPLSLYLHSNPITLFLHHAPVFSFPFSSL